MLPAVTTHFAAMRLIATLFCAATMIRKIMALLVLRVS